MFCTILYNDVTSFLKPNFAVLLYGTTYYLSRKPLTYPANQRPVSQT